MGHEPHITHMTIKHNVVPYVAGIPEHPADPALRHISAGDMHEADPESHGGLACWCRPSIVHVAWCMAGELCL